MRVEDLRRLTRVEYVVCHDTENASQRKYGYNKAFRDFKWRWKYTVVYPYTTVFSNFHDLTEFQDLAAKVR
jgi:hypothetical protein